MEFLVPYGKDSVYSLYKVQFNKLNRHAKLWRYVGKAPESLADTLKDMQSYFDASGTPGEFEMVYNENPDDLIEEISDNTTSVLLGFFLAAARAVENRRIKEEWNSITVTGDIGFDRTNGHASAKAVREIDKKFEAFLNHARTQSGKHLFVYVADNNLDDVLHKLVDDGLKAVVQVQYFPQGESSVFDIESFVFVPTIMQSFTSLRADPGFDNTQKKLLNLAGAGKTDSHPVVSRHFVTIEQRMRNANWHGFVIHGPDDSGKTTLAKIIVSCLMSKHKVYAPLWITVDGGDTDFLNNKETVILKKMKEIARQIGIPNDNDCLEKLKEKFSGRKFVFILDAQVLDDSDAKTVFASVKTIMREVFTMEPYLVIVSRLLIPDTRLEELNPPEFNQDEIESLVFESVKNMPNAYRKISRTRENKKVIYDIFLQSLYDNFMMFPGIIPIITRMLEKMSLETIIKVLQTKFDNLTIPEQKRPASWKKWLMDWEHFVRLKESLTQDPITRYYHVHMTASGTKDECINHKCKLVYLGSGLVDAPDRPIRTVDTYSSGTGITGQDYSRAWKELHPRPPYGEHATKGGFSRPEVTAETDDDSLFYNGELVFLTELTEAIGGVGLHVPYFTEYITFTVDMSDVALEPVESPQARLRLPTSQTRYDLLQTNRYGNKKIWVISGYNIPPNSNIEFSWGDHPKKYS